MTGRFLKLGFALAWILGIAVLPLVAAPGVSAQFDAKTVVLGETVSYTLTMSGVAATGYSEPVFPIQLELLDRSQQRQISMVNGRNTSTIQLIFRLRAIREGVAEVPAVLVRTKQGDLKTEAASLTITRPAPRSPGEKSKEPLFLEVTAEPKEVYLGEPVSFWSRVFLVDRLNHASIPQGLEGRYENFRVDQQEIRARRPEWIQREGGRFSAFEVDRKILVPLKAGELSIMPGGAQVSIQRDNPRYRSRSIFPSLFRRSQQETLDAPPNYVKVLPVPQAGRPRDDLGLIGRKMKLKVTVEPSQVEVGEPIHFRVFLEGQADLRGLAEIPVTFPDSLTVFETNATQEIEWLPEGARSRVIFESVVVPSRAGTLELPALDVPFFDAEKGSYERLKSEAKSLQVKGVARPTVAPSLAGPTVQGPELVSSKAPLSIRYIREDLSSLEPRTSHQERANRRWIYGAVLLLLTLAIEGLARWRNRFAGDSLGLRASRAYRNLIQDLGKIDPSKPPKETYGELVRILREYIAARSRRAAAGLHRDEIPALLEAMGLSSQRIDEGKELLASMEELRYLAPEDGNLDRDMTLSRAWARDVEKEAK